MSNDSIATPVLTEYRFRLVGCYDLDVRVLAANIYEAKGKLLSEVDVTGVTAQLLNRRYHGKEDSRGESWCDDGLVAYYIALAAVDLGRPYYDEEYESTLYVRQSYAEAQKLSGYRFVLRYGGAAAYELSFEASCLEEALDKLFDDMYDGFGEFTVTADSSQAAVDSDTLDSDSLGDELAQFALLTADRALIEHGGFVVSYEIVEAAASATE